MCRAPALEAWVTGVFFAFVLVSDTWDYYWLSCVTTLNIDTTLDTSVNFTKY